MYSAKKIIKDGRTLLIREAEGKDAGFVLDFLKNICAETDFLTFGPGEFLISEVEEYEYLEKCRHSDSCVYLLALVEDKIIGALWFQGGARPRTRHAGELGTAVLQTYWGLGVGSFLIDALLEWCRKSKNICKLNLRVRTDNHRAINLYQQKGFLVEGTLRKDFFVSGIYYDNLWMGLEL
jgi:RimJ/RimL family protein N-acetyltransferase